MKDIKFLDCTLRDGAHVVSGSFGQKRILDIIGKLSTAHVDMIEFGFLKMCSYEPDKIYYPRIENAYALLDQAECSQEAIYALMARADEYDIRKLTDSNGRISLIRVAFYYDFLDGGIEFAKQAMDKGYLCSLNLINTPGATLEELKVFADRANEIRPFAVSLVDTFGMLNLAELQQIIKMYDARLDKSIRIGLHVHENLSLTFALAQRFLAITEEERKVIVDGSLMGIGRSPGNLCSELIASYLNDNYGKKINIHKIMDAVSKDIKPLKKDFSWGYSPEFFLSAICRVHRSYAEYLEKRGISLENIRVLLGKIDLEHKGKYNRDYIRELAEKEGLL